MNELDPAVKRLIKWSRGAVPSPSPSKSMPEAAPFGFSGRVVAAASARWSNAPTLLQELQQSAWSLTCVSLALIVCGGLVLLFQPSAPAPAAEISSALNFVAINLPQ